ncbi:hypothetical protein [Terribacillus saccharophilus]|uniref:hypothetical protein n=1 Tax=Terribacillus saccharophilus TaxID=361277 RepID=UPI003981BA0D
MKLSEITEEMQRIHLDHYITNDFQTLENDKEVAKSARKNIKEGLTKLKRLPQTKQTKEIRNKQIKVYELTIDVIRLILIDRKSYAEKQALLVSKANEDFRKACENFLK